MFCFLIFPCSIFLYVSNSRLVFQGSLELQTGVEFLVACVHMDLLDINYSIWSSRSCQQIQYILAGVSFLMSHCFYILVKGKSEAIFAMSHVFPLELNFRLVTHLTVDQTLMCKMPEVLKTMVPLFQARSRKGVSHRDGNKPVRPVQLSMSWELKNLRQRFMELLK